MMLHFFNILRLESTPSKSLKMLNAKANKCLEVCLSTVSFICQSSVHELSDIVGWFSIYWQAHVAVWAGAVVIRRIGVCSDIAAMITRGAKFELKQKLQLIKIT